MRIHTDRLTFSNIIAAARLARADIDIEQKGSKSRERAFVVHLTGESKRRPNRRGKSDPDAYAATWDQWGVFLGVLFHVDSKRTFDVSLPMSAGMYSDQADFNYKTDSRFVKRLAATDLDPSLFTFWPADAHGDHTFKWAGVPYEKSCTKCSAVQRWQ